MNTTELYDQIEAAKASLIRLGYSKERIADLTGQFATEAAQTGLGDKYILSKLKDLIQKEYQDEKGRS